MKRFLLFKGINYYPCGGMDDFVGDFDTLEEAIKHLSLNIVEDFEPSYQTYSGEVDYALDYHWSHIYDCEIKENVVDLDDLKTSELWQQKYPDITVLDPDGWDRADYDYSWTKELIRLDEYKKRVSKSTCKFKVKFEDYYK